MTPTEHDEARRLLRRDEFAAAALQGLLASGDWLVTGEEVRRKLAETVWQIADALEATRK